MLNFVNRDVRSNRKNILSYFFILTAINIFVSSILNGQKKDTISFEFQNKSARFKSISAGMGISYSNNPDLIKFAGYEIPDYFQLPVSRQFSDYSTGIEYFGAIEYQIFKDFSGEVEYNYFSKHLNLDAYSQYEFNYNDHRVFLNIYYLIPDKNAYLKIGAGFGLMFSDFVYRYYGAEYNYRSTGVGFKINAVLNLQLSKNIASYFSVYGINTLNGDLQDSSGNTVRNKNGDKVNLNSLGVGLKLGLQFILF